MKKLTFIFSAVCILLSSISCNKDDDDAQNPLIGSWIESQYNISDGSFVNTEGCDAQNTLSINADETWEYVDYDSVEGDSNECEIDVDGGEEGTWEFTGDNKLAITYMYNGESDTDIGRYIIEGDTLTITYENEPGDDTIEDIIIYTRKQ